MQKYFCTNKYFQQLQNVNAHLQASGIAKFVSQIFFSSDSYLSYRERLSFVSRLKERTVGHCSRNHGISSKRATLKQTKHILPSLFKNRFQYAHFMLTYWAYWYNTAGSTRASDKDNIKPRVTILILWPSCPCHSNIKVNTPSSPLQ